MNIVTITSDWNKGDYYLGTLKGALYSLSSDLRVIDLANSVPSFDVLQEIFILKSSFYRFPKATIHLMGVMSEPTPNSPMVIVFSQEHYFIGVNDGRFSLLLENVPSICFKILEWEQFSFSTFCAIDFFTRGVDIIINNLFESCTEASAIKKESKAQLVHDSESIIGRVIYCDSFGNAITNIKKSLFDSIHNGRDFTIFVRGPYLKINKISNGYFGSFPGEIIALFNSLGYLELAVNQGNMAISEGLDISTEVRVKFITNT
ncbi:MAG: SAM-dependent chlorinase/fluorinase [Bacteroidales bacterium]